MPINASNMNMIINVAIILIPNLATLKIIPINKSMITISIIKSIFTLLFIIIFYLLFFY